MITIIVTVIEFVVVNFRARFVNLGHRKNVDIRCVNIMDTTNPYRGVTLEGPCPHKRTLYGSCPHKRTLGGYCPMIVTVIVFVIVNFRARFVNLGHRKNVSRWNVWLTKLAWRLPRNSRDRLWKVPFPTRELCMAPVPVIGLWVVTVPVRRLWLFWLSALVRRLEAFTTILEYIKWFLVEKIRFLLKQKPLFTLFIVYFIWITYILRDVSGFQTLHKVCEATNCRVPVRGLEVKLEGQVSTSVDLDCFLVAAKRALSIIRSTDWRFSDVQDLQISHGNCYCLQQNGPDILQLFWSILNDF
jgi:hypothetical protein